jgi:hypothetical protein
MCAGSYPHLQLVSDDGWMDEVLARRGRTRLRAGEKFRFMISSVRAYDTANERLTDDVWLGHALPLPRVLKTNQVMMAATSVRRALAELSPL